MHPSDSLVESVATYDHERASVTYGIIAVGMDGNQYQDGTYEGSAEETGNYYHATRDAYVAKCCWDWISI